MTHDEHIIWRYRAATGSRIEDAVAYCIAFVESRTNATVRFDFNGVDVEVVKGSTEDSVVKEYHRAISERNEAYRNSPEYAARRAAYEAKKAQEKAQLEAYLEVAPSEMTVSNRDRYVALVKANSDDGVGILNYAQRLARIVEGRMAAGETFESCWPSSAQIADVEGMSGASYSFAVQFLRETWVHGAKVV